MSSAYVPSSIRTFIPILIAPTPQDTFVVGCAFSDKIVLPETFAGNPDINDAVYSTEYGVYKPHCGLDNVMLSWGHDEVRVSASRPLPVPSTFFSHFMMVTN
jgi:hypothetical protein